MKMLYDSKLRAYFPARRLTMPQTILQKLSAFALILLCLNLTVIDVHATVTGINLATQVSGTLAPTNGGTGTGTWTLGDLLYGSGTNTLAKLTGNTSATQKVLAQTGSGSVSAAPGWVSSLDGSIIGTGTVGPDRLGSGGGAGKFLRYDSTWQTISASLTSESNLTPSGTIDGSNAVFTTAHSCTNLYLFKNGQRMTVTGDYSYSGATITFVAGAKPQTGDVLINDCEY
jgi:hypothetical protein